VVVTETRYLDGSSNILQDETEDAIIVTVAIVALFVVIIFILVVVLGYRVYRDQYDAPLEIFKAPATEIAEARLADKQAAQLDLDQLVGLPVASSTLKIQETDC
jgi:hypothetical protein